MAYLLLVLVIILAWLAFSRLTGISREVEQLKREIRDLKTTVNPQRGGSPASRVDTDKSESSVISATPAPSDITKSSGPPVPALDAGLEQSVTPAPAAASETVAIATAPGRGTPDLLINLKDNWMIWLGGVCIGLAGIFLVRYSIDQGYLGPAARVAGGILLGILLHGAAEWLRRNRYLHNALAALAAGGSITLFAALLAGLHLYQLLNEWLVFAGLSIVALVTMALSILHGPVLAILGILAAYMVPLLLGGQTGDAVSAGLYALIISASALFLMHHVYRRWLWWGMLAGGLFWWGTIFGEPGMHTMSSIYLVLLVYLMIAIPSGDFLLLQYRHASKTLTGKEKFYTAEQEVEKLLSLSLLLVILCQFFGLIQEGFDTYALIQYSPLCLLVLQVSYRRAYFSLHPWILLLSLILGWLLSQLRDGAILPLNPDLVTDFYWYCLVTALIFSAFAVAIFRFVASSAVWMSLATMTPVLLLAVCYVLTTEIARSPQWGLIAAILAAFYMVLTRITWQAKDREVTLAWLFIAGHFSYSLAAAMVLREATMTLALSAQLVSLAWLIKRYQLPEIGWILKAVVAVVVLRLTLNPWLLQYPTDIHWSLWTYGGTSLFCLVAATMLKNNTELRQWTWLAFLHLFALTLWAETRYWLYDGYVYAGEYTFIEAAVNMAIFGLLGLVYHYRVKTSDMLAPLYKLYSGILIVFSLLAYAVILISTLFSFSWAWSEVGSAPVFNLMLLAFGFPVVLGGLYHRYYHPTFRNSAILFTAISGFVFLTLEVRHLWQGSISLRSNPLDGELYSYSALWLALAVTAILAGIRRYGNSCYKGGMLLLAVVIAKLFLIDMSGLEGLLRVASFLGMGLGLLGIAFLHQRLSRDDEQETASD